MCSFSIGGWDWNSVNVMDYVNHGKYIDSVDLGW